MLNPAVISPWFFATQFAGIGITAGGIASLEAALLEAGFSSSLVASLVAISESASLGTGIASGTAAAEGAAAMAASLSTVGNIFAAAAIANPITAGIAVGVAAGSSVGMFFAFGRSNDYSQLHAESMQDHQEKLGAVKAYNATLIQQNNNICPDQVQLQQEIDVLGAERKTKGETIQFEQQKFLATQSRREQLQRQESILENDLDMLGGPSILRE